MRWIAKALLFLVTVALPVFIAACYGAPRSYAIDDRAVGPRPMRIIDEQADPDQEGDQAAAQDEVDDEQD